MIRHPRLQSRAFAVGRIALACSVVACSSDSPECLALPCPFPIAAEITVSATNAPNGITGLSGAVTGAVVGGISCQPPSGPTISCLLPGPIGTYHVVFSAPGYQNSTLDFSVTGSDGGCNRCGEDDTKQLVVVMQPATGVDGELRSANHRLRRPRQLQP